MKKGRRNEECDERCNDSEGRRTRKRRDEGQRTGDYCWKEAAGQFQDVHEQDLGKKETTEVGTLKEIR